MKAATKRASAPAPQASTAKAKPLPRRRGSQGRAAQLPSPALSEACEWLIADTSDALVILSELLELTETARAEIESDNGARTLQLLGQTRRLLWALGTDLRGISGHLTGLDCNAALGVHLSALGYLAGCCADEGERRRTLGPVLEAFQDF